MKKLELSFLQNELNRVSEWIRFSDKKSAFLSAYYSGIFLGIISYKDSVICSISNFQSWGLFFYIVVISITIGLFILGIFFLISSVFPRLKNTNTDKSLFYFGNIAKLKLIDYFNEMEKLTEDEAKKQITNQAEYYIISDSKLISASSSQAVGKSVATFDFTVTAKVSIIAFKKIDIETVSVNNLKASLNDSQTYVSHNPDSIKYSFKAYDQNNSTATIMVNIIGLASTDLENNFSKKDILGLTKEDVIKYFKTKPGVKQVEVIFSPAWVKSVPPLEDHVEINIVK